MPILTEEERVGTLLAGRYRLDSILGRGGTGVVFSATHNWTGRHVAVKLLRPEHSRDLSLTRRFLQEARAAANIVHPNVVQVLDMGNEPDGTVHLVLEMLDGESLGKLLEERGRLDVEETLAILVPIMDALVVAHRQGIIHRDLKPDNVFLHHDGAGRRVPKLLDFGTAKMVDAQWGSATQTGTLVGTPFYMSPEQAEGRKDQTAQTDVWSMGVILYRCLSGTLPFWADSPTKLLIEIIKAEAKPLGEREPSLPDAIARTIDRALAPDVAKRWPTMEALLAALREAAEGAGVAFPALPAAEDAARPEFDPGPAAEPPRTRSRARIALIGAGVGAVLLASATAAFVLGVGSSPTVEADVAPDAASAPNDAPTRSPGGVAVAAPDARADSPGAAAPPVEETEVRAAASSETMAPMQATTPSTEPEPDGEDEAAGTSGGHDATGQRGMRSKRIPGVTREW